MKTCRLQFCAVCTCCPEIRNKEIQKAPQMLGIKRGGLESRYDSGDSRVLENEIKEDGESQW